MAMPREQTPQASRHLEERPFGAIEEDEYRSGFTCIAGLDEVGRGPLAGPVVAAAVVFPRGFNHPEINDSKLLTARKRERLVPVIKEIAVAWGLGIVEVDEIDRINILQASLLAMAKAYHALQRRPDCLLLDGNQRIPAQFFRDEHSAEEKPPRQKTIIKGDQLCLSIAAASIVAKVARDQMMIELDREYPQYGFAGHKGYGSAAHLDALWRYGPSPIHRKSFRPVRAAGENQLAHAPAGLLTKG
jgi:ribonuclease HII